MTRFRLDFLRLALVASALVIVGGHACVAGQSDEGEAGGPCVADGTCDEGLHCVVRTCLRDDAGEGEVEGEGEGEGEPTFSFLANPEPGSFL